MASLNEAMKARLKERKTGNRIALSGFLVVKSAAIIILAAIAPATAANLDLTQWQQLGDVKVFDADRAELSTDAKQDDDADLGVMAGKFNFSGNPAAAIGFGTPPLLEDFLGINPNPSQLDIGGFAYEGSAIKTTISVSRGDKLTFQWQFFTNETAAAIGLFNDYAFLLAEGKVIKLTDVTEAIITSSFFASETAEKTYSYNFTTGGTYPLAFGVIDLTDYSLTSALRIGNVSLIPTNIPETIPESSPVGGLIIFGCFGIGINLVKSNILKLINREREGN
jgi:hypothetical protein